MAGAMSNSSVAMVLALLAMTSCSGSTSQSIDASAAVDGSSPGDAAAIDGMQLDAAAPMDGSSIDSAPGTPVSFQNDIVPLVGNCGGELCHGGLASGTWPYTALVSQPTNECSDNRVIVKPGDPTNSYLIQKLKGVNMCSGVRMPKFGTALSNSDLQTIADWISQGALNN